MQIPVYRNGSWIYYTVPSDGEQFWSNAMKLQAASLYATALSKGFSPSHSAVLAEIFVNKQLYKDIQYNQQYEEDLQSCIV